MKKLLLITLLILCLTGCHSLQVNDTRFKVSSSAAELGSIGMAATKADFTHEFTTRAFPVLQNPVRLQVQALPFDRKIYNAYLSKTRQSAEEIQYADSLAVKPEYVTVSLLDRMGYISEINAAENHKAFTLIKDLKEASVVTGIAVVLPAELLSRIKEADSYYLVNSGNTKYGIALYSQGKETGVIDLAKVTMLGYTLGRFCWAIDERSHWYIADLIDMGEECLGNTQEKIREEEEKNLFKM